MDDTVKTFHRARPRIASLSEAWTEISDSSSSRLVLSSSSPELARRLPAARRHSVHAPCTSAFMNAPDRDKKLFDPLVVPYPPRTHPFLEEPRVNEVKTKEAECPALSGKTAQNDLKVPVLTSKVKVRKLNSCPRARRFSVEKEPRTLDAKSAAFPEINVKPKEARRHSLPVTAYNAAEVVSFLYRGNVEVNNTAQKTLPQIIQPENHGLQQKNKDSASKGILKPVCVVSTKIPGGKHDRVQALQKHLEKAEAQYQNAGLEIKAARLFEWLKDQTGSDAGNDIEC